MLDSNGWEIGLHGSFLSFKSMELLIKEKAVLESITGHKISGIRQHYLNLDNKTWLYQKQAGFIYDTSFGYNNKIGFKGDKYKPFKPYNDYFIVFPMVMMDNPFVANKNKWSDLEFIIDTAIREDSVLVINWHTNHFNENEFPNYMSDYIKLIEIFKSKNAEFILLKDICLTYNQ